MIGNMFLAEFIGTFIIATFIISVKYNNGAADIVINGLCVGITVFLNIILVGGLSGASLNPAVGLV